MSDAAVLSEGADELRKAIEAFPAAEQAALRAVAEETAARELTTARQLLRAQQKTEAHELADAIQVVVDVPNKQVKVISNAPAGQHPKLPLFNEYGTVHMTARPYMRPASDRETERYRAEMEAASLAAAKGLGD